ncbi:MAG: hypothetical protein HW395_1295, partial [candidate division NC10 bacterium]|nr:hypothetical protein [candidate division NC10 bacterium]
MRYRIKELHGSVVIKIDGKAREDDAASARRSLSAFLRRPGVKAILYLAGLREVGIAELGVLEAIRQEVKVQGGTRRLCALRDDLWTQFDRNPFLHVYELYHDLESSLS